MPPRKVLKPKTIKEAPKAATYKNYTKWNESIYDQHPYFKQILEGDPQNEYRVICKLCTNASTSKKPVGFYRKNLLEHLVTQTHNKYTDSKTDGHNLQEIIKILKKSEEKEEYETLSDEKFAENLSLNEEKEIELRLRLCEFLIRHHLPFNISDSIMEFVKAINQEYHPQLIENMKASPTTIRNTTHEHIGPSMKKILFKDLQNSPFSIIIDGASDKYGDNYLGVMVRYLLKEEDKPVTKLFALIELGCDSTGETLYNKIKKELFDNSYNLGKNLVGICTDGGRNMSGKNKGLSTRLQEDYTHLVYIGDLCHIYDNICEEGLKGFPKHILEFIKGICNYFAHSPQRKSELRDIQVERGAKQTLDPLRYIETRWFSLLHCTDRILELWPDLKVFFKANDTRFYNQINDPEFYLLTLLLQCLLNRLQYYQKIFQDPFMFPNRVLEKIRECFTLFCRVLLKESNQDMSFQELYRVKFPDKPDATKEKLLAGIEEFSKLFLARYETTFLEPLTIAKNQKPSIEKEFYMYAREFYYSTMIKMKEKLPFAHDILIKSESIYLEHWNKESIETWRKLGNAFPNIITLGNVQQYGEEIERFQLNFQKIGLQHRSFGNSILTTWRELHHDYPNMSLLAQALLVLPYSSSVVESLFSVLKSFKTPYRNRLSSENLEASLMMNQCIKGSEDIFFKEIKQKYIDKLIAEQRIEIEDDSKPITRESTQNEISPSVNICLKDSDLFEEFYAYLQNRISKNDIKQTNNSQSFSEEEIEDFDDQNLTKFVYRSDSLKRVSEKGKNNQATKLIKKNISESKKDSFH